MTGSKTTQIFHLACRIERNKGKPCKLFYKIEEILGRNLRKNLLMKRKRNLELQKFDEDFMISFVWNLKSDLKVTLQKFIPSVLELDLSILNFKWYKNWKNLQFSFQSLHYTHLLSPWEKYFMLRYLWEPQASSFNLAFYSFLIQIEDPKKVFFLFFLLFFREPNICIENFRPAALFCSSYKDFFCQSKIFK